VALPSSEPVTPKPALLVSACLVGVACNHRGLSSPSSAVASLVGAYDLVPICPEVAGGLPVPRPAAELGADGRVRTGAGDDVTECYERGAAAAVELAERAGAREAVLKARSPSCACRQVYDGTFTRTLVDGAGVTARALRAAGVAVRSEEDVARELGEGG
jgi:uncharacterized protein YbbK (DUF523 family)